MAEYEKRMALSGIPVGYRVPEISILFERLDKKLIENSEACAQAPDMSDLKKVYQAVAKEKALDNLMRFKDK